MKFAPKIDEGVHNVLTEFQIDAHHRRVKKNVSNLKVSNKSPNRSTLKFDIKSTKHQNRTKFAPIVDQTVLNTPIKFHPEMWKRRQAKSVPKCADQMKMKFLF